MQRVVLMLVAFLVAVCASAQSVSYAYDDAGNRVRREIVLSRQKGKQAASLRFESALDSRAIVIYPNPTKGVLKIEIGDFYAADGGNIIVNDMAGRRVLEAEIDSDSFSIDLSDRQSGIYLLTISLNGKSSVWKIIKE